MTIQHSDVTDPLIHEPKGASSAAANTVYVSDGAGSGSWVEPPLLGSAPTGTPLLGDTLKYNGSTFIATPDNGQQFVSDSTYTSGSPLSILAGIRTLLPNDAALLNVKNPSSAPDFWDAVSNRVVPEFVGDTYAIGINFVCQRAGTGVSFVDVELDIGGGLGTIRQETVPIVRGGGVNNHKNVNFLVFVGSTFIVNGAQIYLTPELDTDFFDITVNILRVSSGEV